MSKKLVAQGKQETPPSDPPKVAMPRHDSNATTAIQLSREAFREELRRRGWRMVDAARRWGITPEHFSRLLAKQDRGTHWNDALFGLPVLTRLQRLKMRKRSRNRNRVANSEWVPKEPDHEALRSQPGYLFHGSLVPGAVVIAMEVIGVVAEEGDEGVVISVVDTGNGERYLIRFPNGDEEFAEVDVLRCLCETGKSRISDVGTAYGLL